MFSASAPSAAQTWSHLCDSLACQRASTSLALSFVRGADIKSEMGKKQERLKNRTIVRNENILGWFNVRDLVFDGENDKIRVVKHELTPTSYNDSCKGSMPMSFAANIAGAAVAAKQAQVQMALAAKMAKMNAGNEQSVVQLIESASANLQQAAKAAAPLGLGTSVDISV